MPLTRTATCKTVKWVTSGCNDITRSTVTQMNHYPYIVNSVNDTEKGSSTKTHQKGNDTTFVAEFKPIVTKSTTKCTENGIVLETVKPFDDAPICYCSTVIMRNSVNT